MPITYNMLIYGFISQYILVCQLMYVLVHIFQTVLWLNAVLNFNNLKMSENVNGTGKI